MAKEKPGKASRIRGMIQGWDDYFRDNVTHFYDMQNFVLGKQWDEKEIRSMSRKKKIGLVFNVLSPLANHVLAEMRLHTPNIMIEATDDTPAQVAEIRSSLIKDITFDSRSSVVYQTAGEHSLIGGFGVWVVDTRYRNEKTFEQEIHLRPIENPTKTYFDVGAKLPEKTDGMYCGYREVMTRKRFISLWGKSVADKIGYTDYDTKNTKRSKEPSQGVNNSQSNRIKESVGDSDVLTNEKYITVIYHYEIKNNVSTLYQMSDGSLLTQKELNDVEKYENRDEEGNVVEMEDAEPMYIMNGEIATIDRERKIQDEKRVVHSVWAGDYELESTELMLTQLPMIFVDQHSYLDKEGKQKTQSFFAHAKDPQRFLNYCKSQAAYIMMISRHDQFIGTKDMVSSPETQEKWADPSNTQGILLYDKTKDGTGPVQLQPPQFPPEILAQADAALMNIQYVTGIFDTQLGNQGDVVSGIASDHQSRKGSRNSYVFRDNINRAIAVTAEIINELIPSIYDSQRDVRLNLPEKGMQSVTLNQPQGMYTGEGVQNDMTQGEFKVRLAAGPSTEDQKSDNIQSWQLLAQATPQMFPNLADLVVKSLPLEDKIKVANRLRAMIPPQIIEAGESGEPIPPQPQQPDPQVEAQKQAMQLEAMKIQMQHEKNQADIQLKQQQIENDKIKLQLAAVQSHQDMSIEFQKIEQMQQDMQVKAAEAERRYQAEMERIQADERISHHSNIKDIVNNFSQTRTNSNEQRG